MIGKLREPVNGITHMAGGVLSCAGLIWLLLVSARNGKPLHMLSFAIFGTSLVLLYTASSLYHSLTLSRRGLQILRRFDHMMIYLLIAGTYTPVCLIPLHNSIIWGWGMLAVIWLLAIAGSILKIFWLHSPVWLTVTIYLSMGWLGATSLFQLLQTVPPGGIAWLATGGLFYTAGAIIFALKRPNLIPGKFGSHELWHLFVMAGSFSHFWLMACYVAPLE